MSALKFSDYVTAVEDLNFNAICRTICCKLNSSLNIAASESLACNPEPMTGRKLCRLASDKRLRMIKRSCLVVG